MLMMWLLWDEYYKMLKKYLHHWSNKQMKWDYKKMKNTKFNIISRKPYSEIVTLSTYNFQIVKVYTYLGTILTNEN